MGRTIFFSGRLLTTHGKPPGKSLSEQDEQCKHIALKKLRYKYFKGWATQILRYKNSLTLPWKNKSMPTVWLIWHPTSKPRVTNGFYSAQRKHTKDKSNRNSTSFHVFLSQQQCCFHLDKVKNRLIYKKKNPKKFWGSQWLDARCIITT